MMWLQDRWCTLWKKKYNRLHPRRNESHFCSDLDHKTKQKQDRQCTHIEALSPNQYCRGKAMIITYSEYVHVALFTQQAKRMRRIILLSIAYLTLPYFSTLSHKRHDFRKKNYWKRNVCYDFLCYFALFLILRRSERHMIINVYWSSCQVLVILVRF
jgi:hypothetical protein